jgi:hypothetical protein
MSFSPPSKGKRREKAKGGKEKKGSDGQLFETNGKKKTIFSRYPLSSLSLDPLSPPLPATRKQEKPIRLKKNVGPRYKCCC